MTFERNLARVMKTFAIFLLSKETVTIIICSILASFFCKLLSKATFKRKLSSVSLPLQLNSSTARVFCGMRIAEGCQRVICGKTSAERSANYPLLLFCIPQPKNSAFPQIAKLPFARIAQQMCNRCIPSRGPLKNERYEK